MLFKRDFVWLNTRLNRAEKKEFSIDFFPQFHKKMMTFHQHHPCHHHHYIIVMMTFTVRASAGPASSSPCQLS